MQDNNNKITMSEQQSKPPPISLSQSDFPQPQIDNKNISQISEQQSIPQPPRPPKPLPNPPKMFICIFLPVFRFYLYMYLIFFLLYSFVFFSFVHNIICVLKKSVKKSCKICNFNPFFVLLLF